MYKRVSKDNRSCSKVILLGGWKLKIGLIVPANTKISPYIQYYISFFKEHQLDYKVIVWNKKGGEDFADYTYDFQTTDEKRFHMLYGHAMFAQRCKRIIKKESIDHLVIFTIAPLFFLGKRYLSRFEGRFIADIRDDSPFRRRFADKLKQIGNMSFANVVSSPRYGLWLSESLMCHNADKSALLEAMNYTPKIKKELPVRIVFAGILIEPDRNIQILDELKNDSRFEFIFIGRENNGKKKVEQYVTQNEISNVKFQGEYEKDQIVRIYRNEADLVNIFRSKTEINADALPNKLYDAVMAGIPVIVFSHNKAISEYVGKYNLGLVLEDKNNISQDIITSLQSFDYDKYFSGRLSFLNLVLSDFEQFEVMLSDFTK